MKAAMRTFERVDTPRERAILPRQIVVLVRIPGCSSLEVRASCLRRSELIVRSDNLVIMVRTALTVCSRIRGAISVKPVTYSELVQRSFKIFVKPYHLWVDFVVNNFLR